MISELAAQALAVHCFCHFTKPSRPLLLWLDSCHHLLQLLEISLVPIRSEIEIVGNFLQLLIIDRALMLLGESIVVVPRESLSLYCRSFSSQRDLMRV